MLLNTLPCKYCAIEWEIKNCAKYSTLWWYHVDDFEYTNDVCEPLQRYDKRIDFERPRVKNKSIQLWTTTPGVN